jgi:transposase
MRRTSSAARWVALAIVLTGTGPCGPLPGGRLDGELVTAPIADWSFLGDSFACALEARPADPRSVRATCFQRDGLLYVGSIAAPAKRWPAMVAADPNVRVRIAGKVYERRAVLVTEPAERARLTGGDPPAESYWVWRLDPRT